MYKATLKFIGAADQLRNGTTSNGTSWYVQPMLFETIESNPSYAPKKVVVDAWNDNISVLGTPGAVGSVYNVVGYPESREYNSKWYTSIRMSSIELASAAAPSPVVAPPAAAPVAPVSSGAAPATSPATTTSSAAEADDLPF